MYFFGNTHSIANLEYVFPVPHACLPIFFAENKSENKLNWKALLWKWTQRGFTKKIHFLFLLLHMSENQFQILMQLCFVYWK